jgi:UDP-N-acetylmuramoylalanine--D-glutamate ligase
VKKALVVGLGISGKAAAKLLLQQGYAVTAVDKKDLQADVEVRDLSLQGVQVFQEEAFFQEEFFPLVIVSPGISFPHPILERAAMQGSKILGEAEFALQLLQQRAVAITGTNGKTTVTLLVEHILNEANIKAKAVGNVGSALTEYALHRDPEEVLVVELSSYQLESLQGPIFEAAVLLNITPDHLDRYRDMEEYALAKAKIQHCLTKSGVLYLYEQVVSEFSHLFSTEFETIGWAPVSDFCLRGGKIYYKEDFVLELPDMYELLGKHDSLNALAAWTLCHRVGVSKKQFVNALRTFKKPSHRIEFVKEVNGVSYYDDSKGTNIDAVIQAVKTVKGPLTLLAGGVDKGSSYLPWKEPFAEKVKQIFVFGQSAQKISQELGLFFNVKIVDSLERAVHEAACHTKRGEAVLLSPGCSSFDMFRDYVHRGQEFQRYVQLLEERGGEDDS